MWDQFLQRLWAGIVSRVIVVGVFGVLIVGFNIHRSVSYEVTEAVITSVEKDCYLKDSHSKLVEKEGEEIAYMPCDIAPAAAKHFNYGESAIQYRAKLAYRYVSPADKQTHTDTYTFQSSGQSYEVGQVHAILAHKNKVDQTTWGSRKDQLALRARREQIAATATPTAPQSVQVAGLRGKL
jgi:hypothetical protein